MRFGALALSVQVFARLQFGRHGRDRHPVFDQFLHFGARRLSIDAALFGPSLVDRAGFPGEPVADMAIDACEPPQRLAVRMSDEGGWPLEVRLTEKGRDTLVVLTHGLDSTDGIGDIGPGWEYYLDMLIASRDAAPLPSFDDYYPAQQEYYSSLRPE